MPISLDDQARLPPMIPHEEILERQRQEQLRQFRQYLVDSGAIKCLVKQYQHTAKNELRLDNPDLLKNYLGDYQDDSPEQRDIARFTQENAAVAEHNTALEEKIEDMQKEIDEIKRRRLATSLWRSLTSKDFWGGHPAVAPDVDSDALNLGQIYLRLCGQQVDQFTGSVLVDLVKPFSDEAVSVTVDKENFMRWLMDKLPEETQELISEELAPRIFSAAANEPPFEAELIQAVRTCGLYPEHLDEVAEVVELDRSLAAFLAALAEEF